MVMPEMARFRPADLARKGKRSLLASSFHMRRFWIVLGGIAPLVTVVARAMGHFLTLLRSFVQSSQG